MEAHPRQVVRPLRVRIGHELWYNSVMPENYIVRTELTDEEKKLAAAAASASRDAVQAAFAAGLSITIGKNGKLVEVAPDGTETIIGDL